MEVSKTEKLYLADSYTASFRARVVSSKSLADARYAVVLDRSYFYPESGGQGADAGRIDDLVVEDVQEDGESVAHTVTGGVAPEPGGEVSCRIDWDRRFDHMQQHTGQHVLSRAFIEVADLRTISFHMGEDGCTVDLEGGVFSEEAVCDAERLANRVVEENRPVMVRTVAASELSQDELRRKLPEGVVDARLVSVEGFDVVPCCGTHVRSTGELAVIKVLKWEKVRDSRRVHFKVGRRAFADYAHKHDVVQALAGRFTTGTAEIEKKIEKLVLENQAGKKAVKELSLRLSRREADELIQAAPLVGGVRLVVRLVDGDGNYARALSSVLRSGEGLVAVVGARDGTAVCCASDDVGVDVAATAVNKATASGGTGGGRGTFAQVRMPVETDMEQFVKEMGEDVKSIL